MKHAGARSQSRVVQRLLQLDIDVYFPRYYVRASIEKKNTRKSHCPAQGRLSFKRAQAKREHLKVALLAERHARGPDG